MNKYILCTALIAYNAYGADDGLSKILDMYARQPPVVYVQPNNQLYPVPQSIPVTRGDRLEQIDFMLPEATQTEKIDLIGDRDE